MRRALVLGGGAAGIAAAFALRDRGLQVELLEQHGWLGGRAFSFADRTLEPPPLLDNGPHVILGCYDRFRALLRRLGTEALLAAPRARALHYRRAGGASSALRLARLPVPLALPPALLRWRALSLGERLRALRGVAAALRGAPPELTVGEWLTARNQGGAVRAHLWEPLCRAVMNTEPEVASARLFLRAIARAFSGSAARAAIWLPLRPWREVLGDPAREALRAAGVTVTCGARAVELVRRDGAVARLGLADGERDVGAGDVVVAALPPPALARLLEPGSVPRFESSPIVAVYFTGAAPLPLDGGVPLVALVEGAPFHFVYRAPGAPPGTYALLADGARSLDHQSVAAIEAVARGQLARWFPESGAVGGKARVAKEAHATVLLTPAAARLRPGPGPWRGLRNLLVCGDWTDTGLPCTLEGAVLSAEQAIARATTGP